jgi:ribosomal protein L11 methylase PrmA
LHLDIQINLLESDIALSDATAYNIQFIGPKPVFVDFLLFRRYRKNEHWEAHRQFCEQFLNPLLLQATFGIPFHEWYRGQPEGIKSGHLANLVKWRHHLSLRMLGHVILPGHVGSWNEDKALKSASEAKARGLPRSRYSALLNQLRSWIANLKPQNIDDTTWHDYATENTYADAEAATKRSFVSDFVKETAPSLLIDLGCNTGDYSEVALKAGAKSVIGLDADHGALEQAFAHAKAKKLSFLPLFQDSANPSPGQGWNHSERRNLFDRCQNVDAVIALALEHHLAVGRNIPLPEVVNWIVSLAPQGIIEFVHKDDPTIQKMLALRDDIFTDYSVENFASALEALCPRNPSGKSTYRWQRIILV